MRQLAQLAFSDPPAWFRALLAIRDAATRPFGVKSSSQLRDATASEERVDFFPILIERENEIGLGETTVISISACPYCGRKRALV